MADRSEILSRVVLPCLVETRMIDLKSQSRVHCTCVAFRQAREAARSVFNQYVASANSDGGQPTDDTQPRPGVSLPRAARRPGGAPANVQLPR